MRTLLPQLGSVARQGWATAFQAVSEALQPPASAPRAVTVEVVPPLGPAANETHVGASELETLRQENLNLREQVRVWEQLGRAMDASSPILRSVRNHIKETFLPPELVQGLEGRQRRVLCGHPMPDGPCARRIDHEDEHASVAMLLAQEEHGASVLAWCARDDRLSAMRAEEEVRLLASRVVQQEQSHMQACLDLEKARQATAEALAERDREKARADQLEEEMLACAHGDYAPLYGLGPDDNPYPRGLSARSPHACWEGARKAMQERLDLQASLKSAQDQCKELLEAARDYHAAVGVSFLQATLHEAKDPVEWFNAAAERLERVFAALRR